MKTKLFYFTLGVAITYIIYVVGMWILEYYFYIKSLGNY